MFLKKKGSSLNEKSLLDAPIVTKQVSAGSVDNNNAQPILLSKWQANDKHFANMIEKKKAKFFFLNITSFRYKTILLKEELKSSGDVDVISLAEHWMRPGEVVKLEGYDLAANYCREKQEGGGSACKLNKVQNILS